MATRNDTQPPQLTACALSAGKVWLGHFLAGSDDLTDISIVLTPRAAKQLAEELIQAADVATREGSMAKRKTTDRSRRLEGPGGRLFAASLLDCGLVGREREHRQKLLDMSSAQRWAALADVVSAFEVGRDLAVDFIKSTDRFQAGISPAARHIVYPTRLLRPYLERLNECPALIDGFDVVLSDFVMTIHQGIEPDVDSYSRLEWADVYGVADAATDAT